MAQFPKTKGFTDTLRPIRMECDILDLETEGEIPAQLSGTFHRVHPDAQFPPRFENDQFFNGDGMITLFRFQHFPVTLASLPLGSQPNKTKGDCNIGVILV